MTLKKSDFMFFLGVIFALWFALTAWVWAYFFALFAAYPFGLMAYLIRRSLRRDERPRNNLISGILIAGLIFSVGFLVFGVVR